MIDRLKYTKEQQHDIDAGSKHHGNPASMGIVRPGIFAANPALANKVEDQHKTEQCDGIN